MELWILNHRISMLPRASFRQVIPTYLPKFIDSRISKLKKSVWIFLEIGPFCLLARSLVKGYKVANRRLDMARLDGKERIAVAMVHSSCAYFLPLLNLDI
jgi:hypothetical protein